MRLIAIFGLLAAAGCSADTDDPPYQPPDDGTYDSGDYDDWNDPPADDPTDDGQDDQDATQDPTDDDVTVPPEGEGPAHHDEIEPNDDAVHPTYIGTPNCSADAKLEGTDDNDWFSVLIEEPGSYVFRTYTGEPDDDEATDTRIEVYGRDDLDTAVAADDDAGEGSASRLTVELQPATYYIRVIGYTTATEGEYTIAVSFPDDDGTADGDGDGTDDPEQVEIPPAQEVETESNGTMDSADSMGTAPWTITAILDARDVDYFVFQVGEAQFLTAETGPIDEEDPPVDTVIDLLDADGQTLGSDDDGAEVELFSSLALDLPGPGTYYVRVTGYGDTTHGSYQLSIQ